MILEPRVRKPCETLRLAIEAANRAGITRIGDLTAFAVPGIPVFQVVRPFAKSLTVSQGKGVTRTSAIVSAILESVELWAAENLGSSASKARLTDTSPAELKLWSCQRHELAIRLDPETERQWVEGLDLSTGEKHAVPRELLSLDFTVPAGSIPATSNGLACGNTRGEALASGIAELIEHHCYALFERAEPGKRLGCQIRIASIDDVFLVRLLERVDAAGFHVRAWSIGQDEDVAVIECLLTEKSRLFDNLSPAAGTGCHPDRRIAFLRALLEAVQSRATLFAGARDDIAPSAYTDGREHEAQALFATLAFGDGLLEWQSIPSYPGRGETDRLAYLLQKARSLGGTVVAYEHELPVRGLSLHHCLCPGLFDTARAAPPKEAGFVSKAAPIIKATNTSGPAVLFAGPSVHGLRLPADVELRPPARCGDLVSLLPNPPAVVGLIDGVFGTNRTVWHNEILSLLANSSRVIGGASLGAIRAAELNGQGMEGVGQIYECYAARTIVRDDAVLVAHAPQGFAFQPLTVSLVDAEHILSTLDLPAHDLRAMQRIVRTTDFTMRTWKACLERYHECTGRLFPIPLETLLHAPSLKQADAVRVVEAMTARPSIEPRVRAEPPQTVFWRRLIVTNPPVSRASHP